MILLLASCSQAGHKRAAGSPAQTQLKTTAGAGRPLKTDAGSTTANNPGPADWDEMKTRDTIEYLLKKQPEKLDLQELSHYSNGVTKDDLKCLCGKDGESIRILNLKFLPLNDDDIEPIQCLPLQELNLGSTRVKDLHTIAHMKSITRLNLQESLVNSNGLQIIAKFPALTELDLCRTAIRDEDLINLYRLHKLQSLDLSGCPNLSPASIERLKTKLPDCTISFESADRKELKPGHAQLSSIENELHARRCF